MSRSLTVFAPASCGNLSVGFDALGLALSPMDGTLLGDIVELRAGNGDDWALEVSGPFAEALPADPEQNVVITSCRRFQAEAEKRRALAVAREQEMTAVVQENRAKVVLAEAEIPLAIAESFRSGNLGIMA